MAKAQGDAAGFVVGIAQQLQHVAAGAQAAFKQFAFGQRDATVTQFVQVGHVAGTGHNLDVGEMLAYQVNDFQRLVHAVHRHHQHLRSFGTGGAQQVQPGGVAVEHASPDGASRLDHVHVVVQHGGGDVFTAQDAAHDLPIAAKAGNDDFGVLGL